MKRVVAPRWQIAGQAFSASEIRRHVMDEPWKLGFEIRRLLLKPFAALSLGRAGVEMKAGARLYGMPRVQRFRGSRIAIGARFENRNWFAANAIGVPHPSLFATLARGARIVIGDDVGISGSVIAARQRIAIGDRVLVGADCLIIDNDFHPLAGCDRRYARTDIPTTPVTIGEDVFLGARTIVLKGSHVGARCIVGAGSVVSGSFPPDSLIAGNPARVVRSLSASGGER